LRLWLNLFLPSVKLLKKVRVGSKVRRVYDGPRTPFERVRDCPQADREKVAQLETLRKRLDPFQLARTIERKLERIYGLANRRLCRKPLPAQERGGKKAVEKTLAPRAWKSQTDFHFPPATATAVNLPFRLHLKCLDDQSYGYIPKWLDRFDPAGVAGILDFGPRITAGNPHPQPRPSLSVLTPEVIKAHPSAIH